MKLVRSSRTNTAVIHDPVCGFYGSTIEAFYFCAKMGLPSGMTAEYLSFMDGQIPPIGDIPRHHRRLHDPTRRHPPHGPHPYAGHGSQGKSHRVAFESDDGKGSALHRLDRIRGARPPDPIPEVARTSVLVVNLHVRHVARHRERVDAAVPEDEVVGVVDRRARAVVDDLGRRYERVAGHAAEQLRFLEA